MSNNIVHMVDYIDTVGIDVTVKPVKLTTFCKFHLRANLPISITLPTDLTEYEAERIAAVIRTLPFK